MSEQKWFWSDIGPITKKNCHIIHFFLWQNPIANSLNLHFAIKFTRHSSISFYLTLRRNGILTCLVTYMYILWRIQLFQLRLSPEQSGEVEHGHKRLLGYANKFIHLLAIPSSLSRSYSTFPLCLGDNLNWNSCICLTKYSDVGGFFRPKLKVIGQMSCQVKYLFAALIVHA
jgi:hypothetical protein